MVYQMLLFLIDCKTIKNERIEGIFYRYKNIEWQWLFSAKTLLSVYRKSDGA